MTGEALFATDDLHRAVEGLALSSPCTPSSPGCGS